MAEIDEQLALIEERIGKYRFGNTRFRKVSEQDWANEWKQYFHVTHVGKSLVIKPSWEEYAPKEGEHVIDIDAVAVRVAKENVADNGLSDQIEVREGDLLHGTEGKADVIIANIIADIVIMLLQDIPQKLNDDGVLLASGIIEERMPDVEAAAQAQGLYVDAVDHRGGWVVMQMKKK